MFNQFALDSSLVFKRYPVVETLCDSITITSYIIKLRNLMLVKSAGKLLHIIHEKFIKDFSQLDIIYRIPNNIEQESMPRLISAIQSLHGSIYSTKTICTKPNVKFNMKIVNYELSQKMMKDMSIIYFDSKVLPTTPYVTHIQLEGLVNMI